MEAARGWNCVKVWNGRATILERNAKSQLQNLLIMDNMFWWSFSCPQLQMISFVHRLRFSIPGSNLFMLKPGYG